MMNIFRWIFVLLIIAFIVVAIYANSILKDAVETAGSRALGTKVEVTFASLNPIAGTITMSKIAVTNPKGFSEKNAIELGDFSATISMSSLFSNLIHIHEIRIEQPTILLEPKNGLTNLQALYNFVSAKNVNKASLNESGSSKKKIIIDDFYINNAKLRLVAPQFQNAVSPLQVTIPDIHLQDIGKKSQGTTIAKFAQILIGELSSKASQIDPVQFGTGALRGIGNQIGVDADRLMNGREAEVDALRGLLNGH